MRQEYRVLDVGLRANWYVERLPSADRILRYEMGYPTRGLQSNEDDHHCVRHRWNTARQHHH